MSTPALPQGLENLRGFLDDLEGRVSNLEQPQQPGAVYACLKANLPDALDFYGKFAWVTDTNISVISDGVHWIRQDSGAPI